MKVITVKVTVNECWKCPMNCQLRPLDYSIGTIKGEIPSCTLKDLPESGIHEDCPLKEE